ncbi:hypothetical protein HDV05_004331 [Chytridiales sp. JEL 0842]|nr:hypothetical protein HDV05_004331 [Chytridiales sp. JEL 0842]
MAQKEIELLENVELKFALADTDAKFEKSLSIFFAPVLLKLDSPHDAVRQKVTGICGHVSKRLKANTALAVPVEALLNLFTSGTAGALVKSFALIYLEMGFNRLTSDEEAIAYLPKLVKGIASRNKNQQQTIFNVALPILAKYKEKKLTKADSTMIVDPFDFANNPKDLKFLLDCFLDVILYTVAPASQQKQVRESLISTASRSTENADSTEIDFSQIGMPRTEAPKAAEEFVPPGLSKAALAFITNSGKAKWTNNPQEVKALKIGIIKFIQLQTVIPDGLLTPDRFRIYLAASAESNHEVIGAGEDGLKRNAKPDFEDPEVVKGLYALYQGFNSASDPTQSRTPGSQGLKLKVLMFLLKSARATNEFPSMLQVTFDALYGEATTTKLRSAGMSFVQWIARMADGAKIKPVAPILLSGLLKVIDEGQENAGANPEVESLRGFAYESVGLLSKRAPELFVSDITILKSFFGAISTESKNVRVSVLEALSTMTDAFKSTTLSDEIKEQILAILVENVEKPEHKARYAAAKYANTLFPFSHPTARHVDFTASADLKLEVREEGRRGLQFPEAPLVPLTAGKDEESLEAYVKSLPDLGEICRLVRTMARKPRLGMRNPGVRYVGSYSAEAYSNALIFIRSLIRLGANPRSRLEDITMQQSEEERAVVDVDTRNYLRNYFKSSWKKEKKAAGEMEVDGKEMEAELQVYLGLIEDALKSDETVETRLSMSRILGIVATSELTVADHAENFKKMVEELMVTARDNSKQTTFEARNGAVLALGYVLGRLRYRYPTTWTQILSEEAAIRAVSTIAEELESNSSLHVQGACIALGEIGRYGVLPATASSSAMDVDPASTPSTPSAASATADLPAKWHLDKIIKKLIELGKVTKDTKVQEAAILALGHISVGTPAVVSTVVDFYFSLPTIVSKHVEVNFTIGEALCATSAGWNSTSMIDYLDISDTLFPPTDGSIATPTAETFDTTLERCFKDVRPGGIPVARKAICVWLLSLVKFCGKTEKIQKNLSIIHSAFSSLIADRDEFTQEVASKGIGLVYELGDTTIKSSLVESLVSTLTEGRRLAPQSVTPETTLFQEGALGATPDGSSLSTYQSILSLASDMNQPDLVYKFMSLASHNAIWNSRRGASMGFGSIAAHAERELAPYLPELIPRLYRFQFDPFAKVAESMKSIWKSLVKEPKKMIDEYFDVIMKELLKYISDRQWRTREASCVALADLIHGRSIEQLEPYMQDLWAMCFRALDDIKESVRTAAFSTCKVLTNITVKYCDPNVVTLAEGQKIMDTVMPFFLTKGLNSMAEDVRKFSLSTVLKICKKGGVLLKPHITDVVSILLECLTNMEPQVMSYLTFHVDKYNITNEQLDNSRLTMAKSSPMMEAIESAIDNIDSSVLEALIPKLNTIVRKGVGLPTRAGSARFIVSLVTRVPEDLKPFADSILKALSGAVSDRSPAVRKSFATSIGYIIKLCSDAAIQKLIQYLKTMYVDAENEDTRSIAGITFMEMTKRSPDTLAKFHSDVIPLAFVGKRDESEAIRKVWNDVWEENTAGAAGAVKLYLTELMALCVNLMSTSQSWNIKKQVGLAICDMAKAIGSSFTPQLDAALPLLTESLGGRTWEGKEGVFEALVVVAVECKDYFKDSKNVTKLEETTKIVIREAKKNNKVYRRYGLEYLGKYMDGLNVDRFEELEEFLKEVSCKDEDDDDMDVDEGRAKPLALAIQANAFKALGLCWPRNLATQKKRGKDLLSFLSKNLTGKVWNVRSAVLDASEKFVEKLQSSGEGIVDEATLIAFATALFDALEDAKYSAIREQSSKVLKKFIDTFKGTPLMTNDLQSTLLAGIDSAISKEGLTTISEPLKEVRKDLSGMELA